MKQRVLAALMALFFVLPAAALEETPPISAGAAVLMEKETGEVLCEENAHERLEPASVTKIMTLLLAMEAIDAGQLDRDEQVSVSARAASMGGSQVYLKEGETMSVHELLKSVAVVSGNDAAVALAERLAGSEDRFVQRMNDRAAQLGMADTTFMNCTGLPAAGHLTTAYDIALMSRELILNHPQIREYTTIWIDTIRNGAFQLANTNKLVRFYNGATGLKTGSTDGALYCLSATAERDGMELIAVVLKSPTSAQRFDSARALLDYGFASYTLVDARPQQALPVIPVLLGETEQVQPVLSGSGRILLRRDQADGVETQVHLAENVEAPVELGQKLGEVTITVGGEVRQTIPIAAGEAVERLTVFGIFRHLLHRFFMAE